MKRLFTVSFIVLLLVNGCDKDDESTNVPPVYSMTGKWDMVLQGQVTFNGIMNMTERGDSLIGDVTLLGGTTTFGGLITKQNQYTLQTGVLSGYYYIATGTANVQKNSMSGTMSIYQVSPSSYLGYYNMTCTKQ